MSDQNRVLVLNRLPSHVLPLGEWLSDIVDRVTLVTSPEVASSYEGVFRHVIGVDGHTHGDAAEKTAATALAEGGFGTVVHITEDDVLRAARLRAKFAIPGLTLEQALPYRDKLAMKQWVSAAGVSCPAFGASASPQDAIRFAEEHGWPVVVKPRLGSGSQGVAIVHGPQELHQALSNRPTDDVMIEQFVPGLMYHVDGIIHDGEVRLAVVSRYVNGCLAFHDSQPLGSAQLEPGDADAIEVTAFTRTAVAALPPIDFSPFHLEVFRHDDTGKLVFCEIACRIGGAHVMETLTYAVGVNPARLHVRHQIGLEYGPAVTLCQGAQRYGWLIVPPRTGRLEAIRQPTGKPWIRDFIIKTPLPKSFGPAQWSTDSYLGFVVEGRSHSEVVERLGICAAAVPDLTTWSAAI